MGDFICKVTDLANEMDLSHGEFILALETLKLVTAFRKYIEDNFPMLLELEKEVEKVLKYTEKIKKSKPNYIR